MMKSTQQTTRYFHEAGYALCVMLLSACVSRSDVIEGAPCPCPEGYFCCNKVLCLPNGRACGDTREDGSSKDSSILSDSDSSPNGDSNTDTDTDTDAHSDTDADTPSNIFGVVDAGDAGELSVCTAGVENVAEGKPVVWHNGDVNALEDSYGTPGTWTMMVDGNFDTSWSPVMTDGYRDPTLRVDAIIDLQGIYVLSHLTFQATWDSREMYGYGATLRFTTSIDSFYWEMAGTVNVNRNDKVEIDISPSNEARYVRLEWLDAVGSTLAECWNGWGSIRELQAFGCSVP